MSPPFLRLSVHFFFGFATLSLIILDDQALRRITSRAENERAEKTEERDRKEGE